VGQGREEVEKRVRCRFVTVSRNLRGGDGYLRGGQERYKERKRFNTRRGTHFLCQLMGRESFRERG